MNNFSPEFSLATASFPIAFFSTILTLCCSRTVDWLTWLYIQLYTHTHKRTDAQTHSGNQRYKQT